MLEIEMANTRFNQSKIITIERHILEEQQIHPGATGVLTNLLYDIALAGKVIASKTTRAGLAEILGRTEEVNIQGEQVMKLASFAVSKRTSEGGPGTLEDFLQPGRTLVASGYIAYGSSTMFVYTSGHGVHGFTLDPTVGEFLLSHPNIRMPARPKYFSVNLGYQIYWSKGVRLYTEFLQGHEGGVKGLSLRYIGTFVSDFHRNLLAGGVFYYPADSKAPRTPHGKLRLLSECAPLAFVAEAQLAVGRP